jgi:regulator of nucleoside diphosphate kinase
MECKACFANRFCHLQSQLCNASGLNLTALNEYPVRQLDRCHATLIFGKKNIARLLCMPKGAAFICGNSYFRRKKIMKPKIVISSLDAERLESLLMSLPDHAFPGKDELEEELARAEIVDPAEVPPNVVTMNSTVRFKIESSSKEFHMKLVYPNDADASGGTISILAPVGSALLGLSKGDEIEWPKPGGGVLKVRIEEVTYQPERTGMYRR